MSVTDDPQHRTKRLHLCARAAVRGLPEADLADRVAYCERTGNIGIAIVVRAADRYVELHWAGRLLAEVPIDLLESDEPIDDPDMIDGTVPDFVPTEWADTPQTPPSLD